MAKKQKYEEQEMIMSEYCGSGWGHNCTLEGKLTLK